MKSDIAISIRNVGKKYSLYPHPKDRLKEIFNPLSKKYHKDFWALRDVSFNVHRGETVGIIGENGSGKSTLLQIVCKVLTLTEGVVTTKGRISQILELGAGFNPEFSGKENVYMNGAIMGFSRAEMDERFPLVEEFADIGEFIDQPMKTYSSGMYIRLAFAAAINVDPDILVIDEALAVGDAYFQQKCFKKLREFRDRGKSILFVSHDPSAVKNLCHKVYLLDGGKIVDQGEPDKVFDYYNALIASKRQEDVRIVEKSISKNTIQEVDVTHRHESDGSDNNDDEEGKSLLYRTGNRNIEILDSYILTNGVRAEIIETGKRVDICIEAVCHKKESDVTFGILIRDRLGNDVFGTNTYNLNKSISIDRGERVKVIFSGYLNIGMGEYTLTVAAHSDKTHLERCYDWIDKHFIFRIVPDIDYEFAGTSRLDMKVDFEYEIGKAKESRIK